VTKDMRARTDISEERKRKLICIT